MPFFNTYKPIHGKWLRSDGLDGPCYLSGTLKSLVRQFNFLYTLAIPSSGRHGKCFGKTFCGIPQLHKHTVYSINAVAGPSEQSQHPQRLQRLANASHLPDALAVLDEISEGLHLFYLASVNWWISWYNWTMALKWPFGKEKLSKFTKCNYFSSKIIQGKNFVILSEKSCHFDNWLNFA